MNLQKTLKLSSSSFLSALLLIQPLDARHISPAYVELDRINFSPNTLFKPQKIKPLSTTNGTSCTSSLKKTKKKKYQVAKPSIKIEPSKKVDIPYINSPLFEVDEANWIIPDWQANGVFKLIDTVENGLDKLKKSETVQLMAAMAVLHGAAPIAAAFSSTAALGLSVMKYVAGFSLLKRWVPKSVSSFLWENKGDIAKAGVFLAGAAYYAYHSHLVREPVLYSYFNNIDSIASNVYALDSTYANNTLFTVDSWLRVEAGRDGGKFAKSLVDQLVPSAALALVPKALNDWGVWGTGLVGTDCMLPKLPGSPVPTVCDVVVRSPVEWLTTPASAQVYYSPAAASQLESIGGVSIHTPEIYKAATLYMNLQKFVHVNRLDLNLLLARIKYYKQLQSGADIKAADGKEVALWFQNMASYDDLGQKLASCVSDKDLAMLQEWYEHRPALGWKTATSAIDEGSTTGTPAVPELNQGDVNQIEDAANIMEDFTRKTHTKDRGIVGNLYTKASERVASYFGLGGRGLVDQTLDSFAQSSPVAKPEAQDLQYPQKLSKGIANWIKEKIGIKKK